MVMRRSVLMMLVAGGAWPAVSQNTPVAYYVSPAGTPVGDGSLDRPLDMVTALGPRSPVRPGDTLLLRGGAYRGNFTSVLTGVDGRPTVVRQYPGERSTIDGSLIVRGAWTWYWGFEIGNSNPDRTKTRLPGISVFGPNTKLINLAVHDCGDGIEVWTPAVDAEVYGCLTYHNGWQGPEPDRGHGHSLYVQNDLGTKRIVDNIMFNGFGYGIHAYTEQGSIKGMHFEGNMIFNSGKDARNEWRVSNIYVGGRQPAERITIINNYTYHPATQGGTVSLGASSGPVNKDIVFKNNYIVGGGVATAAFRWEQMSVSGNTFYAQPTLLQVVPPREQPWSYEIDRNQYISPTYTRPLAFGTVTYDFPDWQQTTGFDRNSQWVSNQSRRPGGVKVFARPNQYEPGRIHLAVYNWDLRDSVDLDLQGLVEPGATFEIRNVHDYFGPPVAGGVYGGQAVATPMRGTDSGPEFNVFVLTSRRSSVPPRVRRTR